MLVMDVREQFGQILRKHRISRQLTQEELAFRAGMNVTYLSDIERGRSSPSLVLLVDLSLALSLHPSELLREIDIENLGIQATRKRPKDS